MSDLTGRYTDAQPVEAPFSQAEFDSWHRAQIERGAEFDLMNYAPPGKVAAAFIKDRRKVCAIMGPPGSGKTTSTIFKIITFAVRMPKCCDGVRRCKVMVIRDTYRQLYKTTIASWLSWFPLKHFPEFTGGSDRPAEHRIKFELPNGDKLDIIMEFAAIGENSVETITRGWEGNAAWLNEANYLPPDVLDALRSRVLAGRYPPAKDRMPGVPVPALIVCDFNAPDEESWTVDRLVEGDPQDVGFHRQPGARSAEAENVHNLNAGYYEELARGMPKWKVKRDIDNMVGISRDGMPVYDDWDDDRHLSREPLTPIEGIPLDLGFDQGLHPACIITQTAPSGQIRVLREIVPERIGVAGFCTLLLQVLELEYPGYYLRFTECDPAAFHGADKEGGEQAWADTVSLALRKPLTPALTQEIGLRVGAVEQLLLPDNALRDEKRSSPILVCRKGCPKLVAGFRSKYRWQTDRRGQLVEGQKIPVKDRWSNPHDALQYIVLRLRGRFGIVNMAAAGGRIGPPPAVQQGTVLRSSFDVFRS
jgi:hypothetical protein